MTQTVFLSIVPVYRQFTELLPEETESEVCSAVIAQLVACNFTPNEQWATETMSGTMIDYLSNVSGITRERAASIWSSLNDTLYTILLSVEPRLMGDQRVPKEYKLVSDQTLILIFE
jgi:hypothetical protein